MEADSPASKVRKDHYSVDAWLKLNQLRSDLQTWKVQLARMIEHIDQLDGVFTEKTPRPADSCAGTTDETNWRGHAAKTGKRMKRRITQIMHDYDKNMRDCDYAVDGLSLATQMVSRHLTVTTLSTSN